MKTFIAILAFTLSLAAAPAWAQAATPPPPEPGADRDIDRELAEARRALAEAARRVAEISAAEADRIVRNIDIERLPVPRVRLGVVLAPGDEHADGIRIGSVTADGPAAKAGLQDGDLLLAIGGKSMARSGEPAPSPVRRIREALADANPGDAVQVRYRRGRQERDATLTMAEAERTPMAFSFGYGDGPRRMFEMPDLADAPAIWMNRPLGDYEFVRVDAALGRYFNTDKGLLVVRIGDSNPLNLEVGDVVLSIGGREPTTPTQAARILRSYEPGEKVGIEVMRERRKRSFEVTIPARQRGVTMLRDAAPRLQFRATP